MADCYKQTGSPAKFNDAITIVNDQLAEFKIGNNTVPGFLLVKSKMLTLLNEKAEARRLNQSLAELNWPLYRLLMVSDTSLR